MSMAGRLVVEHGGIRWEWVHQRIGGKEMEMVATDSLSKEFLSQAR